MLYRALVGSVMIVIPYAGKIISRVVVVVTILIATRLAKPCYTKLALFLSMKNTKINHHNSYSFDCSITVFLRAKMQNCMTLYNLVQFLHVNSQFYGGHVQRIWRR